MIKRIKDGPLPTSAVLFRFHHALADGHAVLSLLRKMMSLPNPKISKQLVPAQGTRKGFEALRILGAPYDIIQHGKKFVNDAWFIKDKEVS